MKERLLQILDLEQLSSSKFADLIGVQRSSVSHILSGRNKPSYDFLQKTLQAFPGLNAGWLMMGQGTMYEQMGRVSAGNLFAEAAPDPAEKAKALQEMSPGASPEPDQVNLDTDIQPAFEEKQAEQTEEQYDPQAPASMPQEALNPRSGSEKKVVQVMIMYDDDTFKTFRPAQ